ncbi:deoxynucleotide monophosphate kinase family protein [Streptomyces niveus]|uniref:deoxynucleotide monophosphate kinase family protein n=1 Tax=Streptomyces niveus TaxID=193462 RepID=UPI00365B7EB9
MGNVGIIGRARAGKDTAGAWFVENRGYKRVSFADPLRELALKLDPIVEVDSDGDYYRLAENVCEFGWEAAKGDLEVRRTLQELGAGVRAIDPDFWLRTALAKVTEANENGQPVVITDVRYPNEAESLRRAGFHLVYIDRPGVPHLDHESEGALTAEDAGYAILNDGEIDDFLTMVELFAYRVEQHESRRHYARSH